MLSVGMGDVNNVATARFRGHPFHRTCHVHAIEHRFIQPNHPWTNGQIERIHRTINPSSDGLLGS
jgi:hypothetical protein